MDIGTELTAIMLDGSRISGKLTFGDMARAELHANENIMQRFQKEGVRIADLALLTYQIATRTGQYTGSFHDYLLVLDTFEVPDEDENTEGVVRPFQKAVQEGS